MTSTIRRLAPPAAPLAVAGLLALAPTAGAAPLTCTDLGSATQCVKPGNSQLIATPPVVAQPPQIIIIHRDRR